MSTPLLQVEHLRVTYRVARRKVVAVQDASFVARRGISWAFGVFG